MKRIYINIRIYIIIAALIGSSGCKKILDINEDPNNPGVENATPEVLFPSAVMSSAGMIGGQLAIVGGIWSQYWANSAGSSQYRSIDGYNLTGSSEEVNYPYQQLYAGALSNYQLAITKSVERNDWRYNLMATVMKAYTYEVLVDLYDQVPYSEALQGGANLQPKFDDGYTIYTSLLTEIDAALAHDYSNEFTPLQKTTDFVFAGNMDNWVKFANTLKLKMYLRMVNAKPAEARAGIQKLYADGAEFLDADAGVNVFTDSPDRSNPFYEFNIRRLNTAVNIRASYTFASWLNANGDPRAATFFAKTTAPVIGIHQGDYTSTAIQEPTYNSADVFVQHANDPVWFISEAESYFMQAEVLERYSAGVGAKAMYDAGVDAAFASAGVSRGSLYPYPVSGTFEQKLEAIIVQKWASFPGSHALEGFFEHNRTGYPSTSTNSAGAYINSKSEGYTPGKWVYSRNSSIGNSFPKRLVFPDYERDRNANTPVEVGIGTKVWWAK
ncbi:SusD/RagB family nutrient-binding outer membrane lipoprotein [Arcticibacter eurypsychrophilus]|uniref:SusD/RagB family nutrient-binding outer membrane lipoprotein n=1 Tax=Arcticibacter eurypsychrophilus TaxID=1434752 RepID=UPI00084DE94A|nr:SusD/RagB family nutrient-binding outer membrane lipoprotein [Arcticibacter eurypsychrophilus]